jgi:predicted GNAT family N-acyltransferase
MNDIVSRPYISDDFSACLAIFDSNVPTFFAPEERADFCQFLGTINAEDRPYLVLTRKGSVIACGGLIIETAKRQASLAWGMVDRTLHGQGLGTSLTQARLALVGATPNIAELMLATSQHTGGFYEGFGFTVSKVTPDGFAPGLDRWDMTLHLMSCPSSPSPRACAGSSTPQTKLKR